MNKHLYRFGCVALLAMGAVTAAPQDQPPPENGRPAHRQMDPKRQIKMLTKRLNLTEDQQKQLEPILSDRQQQFDKIRSDSSLSADDRRAKMRSVREDSETKIKAVLTDSQKQTYDQMQQQMRERAQERRHQQDESNPTSGSPQ